MIELNSDFILKVLPAIVIMIIVCCLPYLFKDEIKNKNQVREQ